ncbi:hypothetical protein, conserved [Eimeria tenella]|uniref:Uncharacterized protein n=1 Tax=Eimeria tenella TaxID=5802 RepID=U6L4N8_EIMTE|nr:hypothetical protein, conserved [Eimeria tenella]CDJ42740.1 hypothetical protein, conserved [Eimeria tenella]|eukprot:XP_013233490.1 hypothetical protein, conserved [Eimeria tenella]
MAVGPLRSQRLETIRVLLSSEETHLGLRFQGVDLGYAYTKSALMGGGGGPPELQVRRNKGPRGPLGAPAGFRRPLGAPAGGPGGPQGPVDPSRSQPEAVPE